MRKLEKAMNHAIENDKDSWQLGNTKVIKDGDTHRVYLHGNEIARLGDTIFQIRHACWTTSTTKSRLNAILSEHGAEGDHIYQKDYVWYFHNGVDNTDTEMTDEWMDLPIF